jgi:archaellum component FlaC
MNKLRSLQDIPSSIKNLRSGLCSQSKHDEYRIFNELAQLSRERGRLGKERENWQEKLDRIDARLEQIEEQEEFLRQQIAMKISSHTEDHKQAGVKEAQEMVLKY